MLKQKKGWLKIVEAFIAIMLIVSVVLIVISKGYIGKSEKSTTNIYEEELSILREIELDEALRKDILLAVKSDYIPEPDGSNINDSLPISWQDINFPLSVKQRINFKQPNYLECEAKICWMNYICALDNYPDKDISALAVSITANWQTYNPRQLKLFCWMK